jgi:hypothetical protein
MSPRSCPSCQSSKIRVVESHDTFNDQARRIRRRCINCNHGWTIFEVTAETIDHYRDLEHKLNNLKTFMLSLEAPSKTCDQCNQSVNGRCLLEIPEAGGTFAAECAYFYQP